MVTGGIGGWVAEWYMAWPRPGLKSRFLGEDRAHDVAPQ